MILKKKVWDGYFILYLLSRLNKFLNGFSIQRNRLNNNLAYWDLTWERNKKISLFIKRTSYYCLGVYSKSLELKIVDIRTLLEPTVVTHTCDPSIWENWCRRILSSSPTWTVVWNLIFKKKNSFNLSTLGMEYFLIMITCSQISILCVMSRT